MRRRHYPAFLAAVAGLFAAQGCITVERRAPDPIPTDARHPATVLDSRVPGWETSAWLDDDAFCVRSVRSDGRHIDGQENEFVFCDPAPATLQTPGAPLLPAKPRPYAAPLDPQSKEILLVGAVRGAITDVSVTMFGQTATAAVHPLPATGQRQIGAYAVWLPRTTPGRTDMKTTDITAVIGRDANGRVLTRLG